MGAEFFPGGCKEVPDDAAFYFFIGTTEAEKGFFRNLFETPRYPVLESISN